MYTKQATSMLLKLLVFVAAFRFTMTNGQDYEVADIDCTMGSGGKEILTARLRKPDGFRGSPIFADDRGTAIARDLLVSQDISKESPCQIYTDPTDASGRVSILRITDFSQCGVLKRNGFIHVRVWFPQLPGVVMLSDQEVIIMCKPPTPTILQSKAAGFAGSIPSGARVSGIVEESPGRLEYEVALFRETGPGYNSSPNGGRSVPAGAYITGIDSHELPVDQAVPIGTRLQLRARINSDSAWQHAKLMEVSVSPDPKDPTAEGAVSLVKEGCRNPELASIIPKQPYRYKDRSNEVVLDFEAFLLSNMGEKNTLWLHTQIKACMESQDCHPVRGVYDSPSKTDNLNIEEFCMDVYQPSGYGRKRRDIPTPGTHMISGNSSAEYSSPISQHWKPVDTPIKKPELNESESETEKEPHGLKHLLHNNKIISKKSRLADGFDKDSQSTKFGDNIGFSVLMPAEYYRSSQILGQTYECRGWATATLFALMAAVGAGIMSCALSYRLRKNASEKDVSIYVGHQQPVAVRKADQVSALEKGKPNGGNQHIHHMKYARDSSVYRP